MADERERGTDATASEQPGGDETPPPPGQRPRGKPFQTGNRLGAKGRPRTDQRLRASLDRWSLEAARCLRDLMRDPKTPRETKRKIAEYIVDRKLGRPTTSIAGADGQPLLPPGAPADSAIAKLIAAVRRRNATSAGESSEPAAPDNGPPGANGGERGALS